MEKVTAKNSDINQLPPPSLLYLNNSFLTYILSLLIAVSSLLLFCSLLFAQEIIDPESGKLFVTHTDLTLRTGSVNLDIKRSLLQKKEYVQGPFGNRWRLNWERQLLRLDSIALISGVIGPTTYTQKEELEEYQSIGGDRITFKKDGSAIHQRRDGIKENFDSIGRLIGMEYPNENKVKLTYISVGQIGRIDGPRGHFIAFAYDERGRLANIKSSKGDIIDYAYDHDNLVMVKINNGYLIKYGYGKNCELHKIDLPESGAMWFSYDTKGRVITRRWADDTKEEFSYDDTTRSYKHVSHSGSVTTTHWSQDGRRQEIIDPLGNKSVIDYDEHRRCSTITNPDKKTSRFTYDELGRTATIEGCCGNSVRFEYLENTLLIKSVIDDGGSRQKYDYDLNRNLIAITDADGGLTKFTYYPDGLLKSVAGPSIPEEHLSYHPDGSIASSTNALGDTIRYEYDKRDNVVREIDPLGGVTYMTYNELNQLTSITDSTGAKTSYTYDANGRLIEETDSLGGTTRYAHDARGRITSEIDPAGNSNIYRYNTDGHIESEVDAAGNSFRYEYDSAGRLIREINPLGGIASTAYDAIGRVIMSTTPSDANIRYLYTDEGNILKIISPIGEIAYDYDSQGFVNAVSDTAGRKITYENNAKGQVTKVAYLSGPIKEFSYDPSGNLASSTDNRGMGISFEHDKLGRIVWEQRSTGLILAYQYDAIGNVIGTKDNLGAAISMEYDGAGNLIKTTNPMGYTTRFKYDRSGNLVEKINPLGNAKRMAYNALGAISEVAEATGDTAKYEYDALGRIVKVYHPSGSVTQYDYDSIGNLVRTTNPLKGSHRNVYDKAGYLVSSTDAKGHTTTFSYDSAGRLQKKHLPERKEIHYKYDGASNITEVDDGAFPIRYTYDTASRLTQIEYPAIKRTLKYSYNESGLLSAFTDSEGQTVTYVYDDFGRLKTMSKPGGFTIDFNYDTRSRLIGVNYPNGVKGVWEYNDVGRIVAITYTSKEGKTINGWRYSYDAAGNLIETRSSTGVMRRYRYDKAEQLLEEEGAGGRIEYDYLPGGNRSKHRRGGKTVVYDYNSADQLLKADDETFKYDANGNLVERHTPTGVTRYAYDAENHLVRVKKPGGSAVNFGYAPTGERIWREDSTGRTWFVTDGTNLIAELDENLRSKATYVHASGIDRPLAMHTDGKAYFFHPKALGSIALLTGKNGKIAASYETDAFGNLLEQIGDIRNPFIFTAREYENDIGLYYYRARYYDPKLGRFMTPDAHPPDLEKPLSLNRYIYVLNAPTTYIDPMGTVGLLDLIADPFADPAKEAARMASLKESEKTWALLRELDAKYKYTPEKVDYNYWQKKYGVPKQSIDRVIKLRQNVLRESSEFAQHKIEAQLRFEELRPDKLRTPKNMIKNLIKDVEADPRYTRNLPSPEPSVRPQVPSSPSPPPGVKQPQGTTVRSPVQPEPTPGPRLRGGMRRVADKIRGGARGLGQKVRGGMAAADKSISGTAQWIMKHPKTTYVALTLAHLKSCSDRNLSLADCAIEHAVGSAFVHIVVKLPGGQYLIAGLGAIYGVISIGELGYEVYRLPKDYLQRLAEEEKRKAQAEKNRLKIKIYVDKLRAKIKDHQGQLSRIVKQVDAQCKILASAANEAKKHASEAMKIAQPIQQIFAKAKENLSCCDTVAAVEGEILATKARMQKSADRMKTSLAKAKGWAETCKSEEDAAKIMAEFNLAKGLYNYVTEQYATAEAKSGPLKQCKDKAISNKAALSAIPKIKEQVYAEAEKALKHFGNFGDTFVVPAEAQNKVLDGMCDRVLKDINSLRHAMGEEPLLKGNEAEFESLRGLVEQYRAKKCKTAEHHRVHNQAMGETYKARGAADKVTEAAELMSKLIPCTKPGIKGIDEIKATRADAVVAMYAALDIPSEANACVLASIMASLDEKDGDESGVDPKVVNMWANKERKRAGTSHGQGYTEGTGKPPKPFGSNRLDRQLTKNIKTLKFTCDGDDGCVKRFGKGYKCNIKTGECVKEKPECTNTPECKKKHPGEEGWECNKDGKCVQVKPKTKKQEPECTNTPECIKKHPGEEGWECNKDGKCVQVKPKTKKQEPECTNTPECIKKHPGEEGWECNKEGKCVQVKPKPDKTAFPRTYSGRGNLNYKARADYGHKQQINQPLTVVVTLTLKLGDQKNIGKFSGKISGIGVECVFDDKGDQKGWNKEVADYQFEDGVYFNNELFFPVPEGWIIKGTFDDNSAQVNFKYKGFQEVAPGKRVIHEVSGSISVARTK